MTGIEDVAKSLGTCHCGPLACHCELREAISVFNDKIGSLYSQ